MILKRKKLEFIYLHSRLFRIMGYTGYLTGQDKDKFLSQKKKKKIKGRECDIFLSHLHMWDGIEIGKSCPIPSRPIANASCMHNYLVNMPKMSMNCGCLQMSLC